MMISIPCHAHMMASRAAKCAYRVRVRRAMWRVWRFDYAAMMRRRHSRCRHYAFTRHARTPTLIDDAETPECRARQHCPIDGRHFIRCDAATLHAAAPCRWYVTTAETSSIDWLFSRHTYWVAHDFTQTPVCRSHTFLSSCKKKEIAAAPESCRGHSRYERAAFASAKMMPPCLLRHEMTAAITVFARRSRRYRPCRV